MNQQRKKIIAVAICLIVLMTSIGLIVLSQRNKDVIEEPDYTFTKISYKYYSDDNLSYNFLVAVVDIKQREDLTETLLLSRFNYGDYSLDGSEKYINEVINLKGSMDSLKLQLTPIVFTNHTARVNLFIPYTKDKEVTEIQLSLDNTLIEEMIFQLNNAEQGDISVLEIPTDEPETPVDPTDPTDQVTPGDSTGTIIGAGLIEIRNTNDFKFVNDDGSESPSPISSKSSVFALPLSFNLGEGSSYTLVSATLMVDGSSFDALSSNYQLDDYNNIMHETVSNDSEGYLFFETIQYIVNENPTKLTVSIQLSNGKIYQFTVVLA